MKDYITFSILITSVMLSGANADVGSELERYIRTFVFHDTMTVDSKCGTRYPLLIHAQWNELSESARQIYKTSVQVQPVRERSMETAGGHFRLHWDETVVRPNSPDHRVPSADLDQNNIPDYIDSAAVIFEHVWQYQINELGYTPPPLNDGETDPFYDVYFSDMVYYGITWFPGPDIPSIPGENYATYMEVENDFDGFPTPGLDGLKVTAAHEFHHAMQLGYNVRSEDFFFYEITSTWMEDVVYPEINDYYQYLPDFFNSASNGSFNTYNGKFEYGNNLYLKMLQKKFGIDIVHKVWENIKQVNSLDALAAVLKYSAYSTSWLESLSEYGEWLYFTGQRAITQSYFTDAAEYPEVRILSSDRIDTAEPLNLLVGMRRIANRFYVFNNITSNNLNVSVTGQGTQDGAFRILESGNQSFFSRLNNITQFTRTMTNEFAVVVTNISSTNQDYSLGIWSDNMNEIAFGPNPVVLRNGQQRVVFRNLPQETQVFIYSISGKRIAHLPDTGTSLRIWDLTTDKGDGIASGVYLVLIKGAGVEKIDKLTVLR